VSDESSRPTERARPIPVAPLGTASRARLVIVDPYDLTRAGLRTILAAEPDLEVVAEATDSADALVICTRLRPDLALIALRPGDRGGLLAIRALKQDCPGLRILVTILGEAGLDITPAITAGACGYLDETAGRESLVSTIRRALRGERLLPPRHGAASPAVGYRTPRLSRPAVELTPRETEVLRLVAHGRTNQQIASALTLSLSTVKTHLEHILAKLAVSDRTEAAVYAAELGIIGSASDRPR
jgi:DNA-binding NarL/FixJ family response regulator